MDSNKTTNASHGIKAEKITKPQQLAAAILIGAIALDGIFLTAARLIDQPPWIRGFLVVSAVILAAASIYSIYSLLTKHRELLQDDAHFAKGLAGKNKSLETKVAELTVKIDEQTKLASQRLEMTQQYFENVASRLAVPPDQIKRLGRALRESVRAGEDRVTQEVSGMFLRDTKKVLEATVGEKAGDQFHELFNRFAASRYEMTFQAYDHLIREDVSTVDLAPQLERVANLLLGDRFRIAGPNPPVFISATLGILEVVFTEILMNVRDYSPNNSPVQIAITREPTSVSVCITNQLLPGSVVSEEWFRPGFRGADSSQMHATGAGQGLPLVRRLLSLIAAEVELSGDALLCHLTVRFRTALDVRVP